MRQVGPELPAHHPSDHPTAASRQLAAPAPPTPDVGTVRVLLRAAALRRLPVPRPGIQLPHAVHGHRETTLHHHRLRGAVVAHSAGGDLDEPDDAPARAALAETTPPGLLHRGVGCVAL